MKPILPLFIMVDACGWEILRHDPFARDFAPTDASGSTPRNGRNSSSATAPPACPRS
jgi:hypothetical protein